MYQGLVSHLTVAAAGNKTLTTQFNTQAAAVALVIQTHTHTHTEAQLVLVALTHCVITPQGGAKPNYSFQLHLSCGATRDKMISYFMSSAFTVIRAKPHDTQPKKVNQ